MRSFTVIWLGQMLSLLGTSMSAFALSIWAYETTHQATALALVGFFNFVPIIALSPIAGAIVDRHDRKHIMMLADFAAGLPTIAVLLLYLTGSLQIWQLFITGLVAGSFQAFHFPAYSAAVTMLISKKHYGRASGMLSMAQFASQIFAPILAALILSALYPTGLTTVLIIDIATFTMAIGILFFVHVPKPPITELGKRAVGSIWKESLYGFSYIRQHPSLLGLLLTFFISNLFFTFGNIIITPMVLNRVGDENLGQIILGSVFTVGGIGGVLGSLALTVWGGPKRKVYGVLGGMFIVAIFSSVMGIGQSLPVWAAALFFGMFIMPTINGSSQAIWQSKVAPDVQGRVFSTRLLIAQLSVPIAMLMAGPLADLFFEPSMREGGSLVSVFGGLVGSGPGAGMALMLVISGICGGLAAVAGYSFRVIRNAEDILQDFEAQPPGKTLVEG